MIKLRNFILIALAAGGLVFACDGTAKATNTDAMFITVLDMYSVPYPSKAAAITEAHHACSLIDQTDTLVPAGMDVMDTFPDMSLKQAAEFVGAAVGGYCPWHDDLYHTGS